MQKSILHITVSLLLLVATTGFTITRHYCHNNLMSVVLGTEADSCCEGPCEGCHDESKHFQLDDEFVPVDMPAVQVKVLAAPFFQLGDLVEFEARGFFLQDAKPDYTSLKLPVPASANSRISALQTFLL